MIMIKFKKLGIFFIGAYSGMLFAAGTLDTMFNPLGVQPGTEVFSTSYSQLFTSAIALQSDNKIVISGLVYDVTTKTYPTFVARFNNDGSVDKTFNPLGSQPGFVFIPEEIFTVYTDTGIALQADGKIVIVGAAEYNPTTLSSSAALMRFNADGSVDTTFNATGSVPGVAAVSVNNWARGVGYNLTIQSNGKIILCGFVSPLAIPANYLVARFNNDGSLDTTFNTHGTQPGVNLTAINNYPVNAAHFVGLQNDGKIALVGGSNIDTTFLQGALSVARFNDDGSLDTTFNSSGILPGTAATTINGLDLRGEYFSFFDGAVQGDDKILACGIAFGPEPLFAAYSVVARFNRDGSLDTTFNSSGNPAGTTAILINNVQAVSGLGYSMALQSDGKILIALAGSITYPDAFLNVYLFRLNTDGSLDTTFNANGSQPGFAILASYGGIQSAYGPCMVIQPNTKAIIASGPSSSGTFSPSQYGGIAKFNTVDLSQYDLFTQRLIEKYNRVKVAS